VGGLGEVHHDLLRPLGDLLAQHGAELPRGSQVDVAPGLHDVDAVVLEAANIEF
jgi:hypothetical protein